MKRAVVAILKTTPERVFEDIQKLMEMSEVKEVQEFGVGPHEVPDMKRIMANFAL